MNRDKLIGRLLEIPQETEKAEEILLETTEAHAQAKLVLECREADLILVEGPALGSNAETRKARIHVGTLAAQEAVAGRWVEKEKAAAALRVLQAEFSALRSVARLMSGGE